LKSLKIANDTCKKKKRTNVKPKELEIKSKMKRLWVIKFQLKLTLEISNDYLIPIFFNLFDI